MILAHAAFSWHFFFNLLQLNRRFQLTFRTIIQIYEHDELIKQRLKVSLKKLVFFNVILKVEGQKCLFTCERVHSGVNKEWVTYSKFSTPLGQALVPLSAVVLFLWYSVASYYPVSQASAQFENRKFLPLMWVTILNERYPLGHRVCEWNVYLPWMWLAVLKAGLFHWTITLNSIERKTTPGLYSGVYSGQCVLRWRGCPEKGFSQDFNDYSSEPEMCVIDHKQMIGPNWRSVSKALYWSNLGITDRSE